MGSIGEYILLSLQLAKTIIEEVNEGGMRMKDKVNDALKQIPAVDAVVKHLEDKAEIKDLPRPLLVEGVRGAVAEMRCTILKFGDGEAEATDTSLEAVAWAALGLIKSQTSRSLKRVVNATGTILHTNLGRSILAKEALDAVVDVAGNYSNLEYNLKRGERGERYDHVEEMLCRLTGAEKALVVNNNAAAVLLALSTLAKGRDTVVSRGELVEIGGSFRIPAVMELSGTRLVEVGTTNKSHLSDYRDALTEDTALLLKVHPSNYRVVGFTEEVPLKDLVLLGQEHDLPVLEDLGSGVLADLAGFQEEPVVGSRISDGAAVVTFSGDKLLGGPQAGIIVGQEKYITAMKKNQLTRALRIDKLTLAALEATLLLYVKNTLSRVPTWRMLTVPLTDLKSRAHRLAGDVQACLKGRAAVEVNKDTSAVGGGALPLAKLPTYVVAVKLQQDSISQLAEALRRAEPPLIARVQQDRLLLDVRTLLDDDLCLIPTIIKAALDDVSLNL